MSPAQLASPRARFYSLASKAIAQGILTPAEVRLISRQGTRKAGYWGRHLHDLKTVLKQRLQERQSGIVIPISNCKLASAS